MYTHLRTLTHTHAHTHTHTRAHTHAHTHTHVHAHTHTWCSIYNSPSATHPGMLLLLLLALVHHCCSHFSPPPFCLSSHVWVWHHAGVVAMWIGVGVSLSSPGWIVSFFRVE